MVWWNENGSLVDETHIVRDGFLAMQDRDGNNAVLREYIWGLNLGGGIGGLLHLKQGGQDYSYLYDGKGNVGAVLDATQAVVAAYLYDPFGTLLVQTGSLHQPFQFSTKRYDVHTGLSYYGRRFYAPENSRWMTRDPLGEAGGLNLYAFVGNNPVNWVDPWGLQMPLQFFPGTIPSKIIEQTQFDKKMTHISFVINPTSERVLVSGNDPDSGKQLQWEMPPYSISLFLDTPFQYNDIDAVYYGGQVIKLWGPPGAWIHLPKWLRPDNYESPIGDFLTPINPVFQYPEAEDVFGGIIPLENPCE